MWSTCLYYMCMQVNTRIQIYTLYITYIILQHNTELNGNRNDINVQPVWLQGITGKGVTIGIVDDGKYFVWSLLIQLWIQVDY